MTVRPNAAPGRLTLYGHGYLMGYRTGVACGAACALVSAAAAAGVWHAWRLWG